MALIVYSLLFLYILYLEKKSQLNWIFALGCLAMAIWSFAFAVSISADNLLEAIRWQRVAVWGYGIVYSLLLHFAIILTKNTHLLKFKPVYGLIYIPAVINLLLYSFKTPWFPYEYQLKQTPAGWVPTPSTSILDWYFYAYFSVFVLLTLVLFVRWRIHSDQVIEIKQFKVVFISLMFALLVGAVTDLIMSDVFQVLSPQIGPLLILIPLIAAMYAAIEYGMMITEKENTTPFLLQSKVKLLLQKYIAAGFGIGGLLTFLSETIFFKESIVHALAYGSVIALLGLALRIIIRSKATEDNKDNLVLLVISIAIPFVMFASIGEGGMTVWVVPFLFIIAFMHYNKGKMLVGLTVASMLSLLVTRFIVPQVWVMISQETYYLRMLLLAVGSVFAALINRLYMERLKENAEQLKDQQMIAEISSLMVSGNEENFDDKLNQVLATIGQRYGMDRAYFFAFSDDGMSMSYTHEWCNQGIVAEIHSLDNISVNTFPWWMNELKRNKVVSIPDVLTMPNEASKEQEELRRQMIKSTMAVSVFVKDQQIGYIGLDAVKAKMFWRDDIVINMQIIGNVISDAFTKNNAEKVIHQLAYYDQLTGLPSRQLFKDRLFQAMKMADRTGQKVGVALLDLDAFKVINDTLGHDNGDLLLIEVARRLEDTMRHSDTVCRFGGDEFLLLCNELKDIQDAIVIGDEVVSTFSQVFAIGQDEVNVTASMGIAIYPEDGKTADKLIKNADIAMYHAKDLGKNIFALCNDQLKDQTIYTSSLTNALFKAMENNELFMCYQPQVALTNNRITGVEALIRWRHKEIGLIAPSEFIHIAERNGYILEIGEWVIGQVFKQMQAWSELGYDAFVVAINISFIQMQNKYFVELLQQLLQRYAIDPSRIELEITESIAMNQKGDFSEKLEAIRKLGIRIAIDDFGTEYSSLGRLKDLAVDKIKIARPFIEGISKHNKDEAIIKSIIALAKNLDIQTIAEGVESDEQLGFLNQEACDYIQGFLYYKPMLAEEVTELLKIQGK